MCEWMYGPQRGPTGEGMLFERERCVTIYEVRGMLLCLL